MKRILCASFAALFLAVPSCGQGGRVLIYNINIIDVESGRIHNDGTVLIEGSTVGQVVQSLA